ncbi:hypothetical protein A2Z67_02695 [Candidatus Woesebacteria bacterium RBG_13_36_22]|uniref:Uncharacterized protein n=1 Tax=Candidatus Woesebacteria bacterium RBG_13_36_22 TaxID=1802478 RepID=A0A1F7X1B4_9BACT|nr:MAG: hypothetical protein A2Z67_02695 [Candidatus Woesebacteria bacterium RBG_13_36_22]
MAKKQDVGDNTQGITPQNVGAQLGSPDGTNLLNAGVAPGTNVGADKGEGETTTPPVETFTPSPVWTYIKAKEGNTFVEPTDLNKDNEQERIDTYFAGKYKTVEKQQININPLAIDLHNAVSQPDFDLAKWTQAKIGDTVVLGKTDEEVIRYDLVKTHGLFDETKNPGGLKEDDIKSYVDGLNTIQKKQEARRIRESIKQQQTSSQQQLQVDNKKLVDEQVKKISDERNVMLNKLFVDTRKIKEIAGLPLSQTQHEAFEPVFRELITPPSIDKDAPINELLSNNETLYRLAYMLLRQGEFKAYHTDLKEKVKQEIWDKLELNPEIQEGIPGQIVKTDVKTALSSPDRGS